MVLYSLSKHLQLCPATLLVRILRPIPGTTQATNIPQEHRFPPLLDTIKCPPIPLGWSHDIHTHKIGLGYDHPTRNTAAQISCAHRRRIATARHPGSLGCIGPAPSRPDRIHELSRPNNHAAFVGISRVVLVAGRKVSRQIKRR